MPQVSEKILQFVAHPSCGSLSDLSHMQGNEQEMGKPKGKKNNLFSWGPGGGIRTGVALVQKIYPPFSPIHPVFSSLGPAPLFSHPPPACLVIQEEEAKESNVVLEIGLEGQ